MLLQSRPNRIDTGIDAAPAPHPTASMREMVLL
jgi:hypothetical protein